MKRRTIVVLILAGSLLAGVAGAQMAPGMHGSEAMKGQDTKGMMAGGMMKACEAMMAGHHEMNAKMQAMDGKLDQMVAAMNAASGSRKTEAMAAVLDELVAQRKAMRTMSMTMESRMMRHMMEHMRMGAESMAMCPMMEEMAGDGANLMKTGDDGPAHRH